MSDEQTRMLSSKSVWIFRSKSDRINKTKVVKACGFFARISFLDSKWETYEKTCCLGISKYSCSKFCLIRGFDDLIHYTKMQMIMFMMRCIEYDARAHDHMMHMHMGYDAYAHD